MKTLSTHRLNRLLTWARIWLAMVCTVLPEDGGMGPFVGWMAPVLRERVSFVRTLVLRVIFLHAAARVVPPERKLGARAKHAPRVLPSGAIRIAIGVSLRRAVRGRALRAQVDALVALVRDPEAAIARLARRLRRGLKRRAVFAFVCALLLADALVGDAPATANTS